MLARSRLVTHPSPVIRLMAQRDHIDFQAKLIERIAHVYQSERERISANRRWQYSPESRLEILQIMRLTGWSVDEAARRFALHPNTIRSWMKALCEQGDSSPLFTAPVWNRIHDGVRWAVHQLRRLCPEPEFGTRTIARHFVRAGILIHRSSIQRIIREDPPKGRPGKLPLVPAEGCESTHLLAPNRTNKVWHLDLVEVRFLWMVYSVAAIVDGFTRRIIQMKAFVGQPKANDALRVMRSACKAGDTPNS